MTYLNIESGKEAFSISLSLAVEQNVALRCRRDVLLRRVISEVTYIGGERRLTLRGW
jgi:hypothetical protein